MDLFLVVLGGRIKGCHVELHDVRWVVGDDIEDTIPELKRQWFGTRRGLHIDSYRKVRAVDGYQVSISRDSSASADQTMKLWFVNLGGYSPSEMAEQHRFGLVVARPTQAAKARAKKHWLDGLEQIHKDDLHPLEPDAAIDDLLPIDGNGAWQVVLTPDDADASRPSPETPDWYGYWVI